MKGMNVDMQPSRKAHFKVLELGFFLNTQNACSSDLLIGQHEMKLCLWAKETYCLIEDTGLPCKSLIKASCQLL